MVLRLGAILGQNFRDLPGGYAEVLCDLVTRYLLSNAMGNNHPISLETTF